MRIFPILSAACAIAICAVTSVNAQQPATTPRSAAAPAKLPPGMSFAWDASHTQITSTGVQLKASTLKSNSVSPTTGYVNIHINIKVRSRLEASTVYHCSAYLLGGIIDLDNGTVDGGLETANALASGSSGTYTCSFAIPYSWTLASDPGADSGLIIAFGASGLNTKGEVVRATLQVDGIENLPENGASSLFVYNVAL